ncbi:MAG: calcium/sodium antiporter [Planctomycetota bacterium]|nr:calcium/sodium antiporter [Planctomycetota bacterium]
MHYVHLGVILLACAILWKICDLLVESTEFIAERFQIPQSIAGATLLAISSSAPEFGTNVFSVTRSAMDARSAQQAGSSSAYTDIGLGTIIGSAIFNICMIIGISALFQKLTITNRVLKRDGLAYFFATMTSIVFIADGRITWTETLIWLAMYLAYIAVLFLDLKRHPEEWIPPQSDPSMTTTKAIWKFLVATLIIGIACHFMVESTAIVAQQFQIPSALISVILLAIGTSIPDIITSVQAARRGNTAMAVSNAIGSNIFDIAMCLGAPLAIYTAMTGTDFQLGGGVEASAGLQILALSVIALAGSVFLSLIFLKTGLMVTRAEGIALILFYLGFASVVIFAYIYRDQGWLEKMTSFLPLPTA